MAAKATDIYTLEISLAEIEPRIWRRVKVAGRTTLQQLHLIIQGAMGWELCHLHQFEVDGVIYSDPELADDRPKTDQDSRRARLHKLVGAGGRFVYEYDFGDDWRHEIVVESITAPKKGGTYPFCIAGARACPPEDVGGPHAYEEYLDAIKNPRHERHEELLEWRGEFDAQAFSVDEANLGMRRMKRARG
jgi:hypothetical protein